MFTPSRASALAFLAPALVGSIGLAQVNVWVDTSQFDGLLDLATSDSSTAAFTGAEKQQIKDKAVSELGRIYAGYNVNFFLTDPGGNRDIIRLGETYPTIDAVWGSTSTNGLGNYITNATANVYIRNFGVGIIPGLPAGSRANALGIEAGTVASHELGHIFGLNHWHKFGAESITPATYLNTGQAAYNSLMANTTAPYGVQNRRNLNRFERAILDITGGTSRGGQSIVNQRVFEVAESTDAGATPATARPLQFAEGESSHMRLAMMRGQLDNTASDVDLYSFTTTSAGLFTCNIFSGSTYFFGQNRDFNPKLRLLAADGTTVVAEFDDLYYDADIINHSSYIDFGGFEIQIPKSGDDPFMLNIPIGVGTYYLEISPVSGNAVNDGYQFLAAYDGSLVIVPEPTGACALAAAGLLTLRRRRRRQA